MDNIFSRIRHHASLNNANEVKLLHNLNVAESKSYQQLLESIENKACWLHGNDLQKQRVLLFLPTGLDFVEAFLACLRSGVIAVPVPHSTVYTKKRADLRIKSIVDDCKAQFVIVNSASQQDAHRAFEHCPDIMFLHVDNIYREVSKDWACQITDNDVAYLQYSSGSTGNPKGVVLTHSAFSHHLHSMAQQMTVSRESRCLTWMPHWHDYGLIDGISIPIYAGSDVMLMSPTEFIKRPLNWVTNISKFDVTHTSCPSFTFDLCNKALRSSEAFSADLACLDTMTFGAEPIVPKSVREFAELTKSFGLKEKIFRPSFGLAEATLFASSDKGLHTHWFDRDHLQKGEVKKVTETNTAVELVSCGAPLNGIYLKIVDPQTHTICENNKIGEVWLSSSYNGSGYWEREEESNATFRASIRDGSAEKYLRTGDTGFLFDGKLYIVGRLKDTIIIHGENHSPSDIEQTVIDSDPMFLSLRGAAVSIVQDNKEKLVIVQECPRDKAKTYSSKLAESIKQTIFEHHGLAVEDLVFIPRGSMPKTTSGKVQRRQVAQTYEQDRFSEIRYQSDTPTAELNDEPQQTQNTVGNPKKLNELRDWLADFLTNRVDVKTIDERRSIPPHIVLEFGNMGLLGLSAPQQYGGQGFNHSQLVDIYTYLASFDINLATFVVVHNSLGVDPIVNLASEEFKTQNLPLMTSGRKLGAFAYTEELAGSNIQAITSAATRQDGNSWRIDGKKIWIGNAGWSGFINVFCKEFDPEGGAPRMVGFAVDTNASGLKVGAESLTMGMRGMVQNDVHFDNLLVTTDNQLGEPNNGLQHVTRIMTSTRIWVASMAVGVLARCLDAIERFAAQREIATGKLSDNGVIQVHQLELLAQKKALAALVSVIAKTLDNGSEVPSWVIAAAKYQGSEFAFGATDTMMQLMGGRGYEETELASRMLRDVRVFRIFEGASEAMLDFLGSQLSRGQDALIDELDKVFVLNQKQCDELSSRIAQLQNAEASTRTQAHLKKHIAGKSLAIEVILASVHSPLSGLSQEDKVLIDSWAKKLQCEVDAKSEFAHAALDQCCDLLSNEGSHTVFPAHVQSDLNQTARALSSADYTPNDTEVTEIGIAQQTAHKQAMTSKNALIKMMQTWISEHIDGMQHCSAEVDQPFVSLGLDSISSVMLIEALEQKLERKLSTALLWQYSTIAQLAEYLSDTAVTAGNNSTHKDHTANDDAQDKTGSQSSFEALKQELSLD